jgi:hypothetical protein
MEFNNAFLPELVARAVTSLYAYIVLLCTISTVQYYRASFAEFEVRQNGSGSKRSSSPDFSAARKNFIKFDFIFTLACTVRMEFLMIAQFERSPEITLKNFSSVITTRRRNTCESINSQRDIYMYNPRITRALSLARKRRHRVIAFSRPNERRRTRPLLYIRPTPSFASL